MAKKKGKSKKEGGSNSGGKAKKGGKKSAKAPAPKAIKTGKGAGPMEVGTELVRMFNAGQFAEIEEKFWAPKVRSIEGHGVALAWDGRKAVRAKNNEWMSTHRIHGASAEGPFVGATGFAVKFRMDVEDTANGQRMNMNEVGVYTIKNGKIVQEEFMYGR